MDRLIVDIQDQDTIEQQVMHEVDQQLAAEDRARDEKLLAKLDKDTAKVQRLIKTTRERLSRQKVALSERKALQEVIVEHQQTLKEYEGQYDVIVKRMSDAAVLEKQSTQSFAQQRAEDIQTVHVPEVQPYQVPSTKRKRDSEEDPELNESVSVDVESQSSDDEEGEDYEDDSNQNRYEQRLAQVQQSDAAQPIEDLQVPEEVYQKLFDYQRTAVGWMYGLHKQQVGGILGDQQGTGKSIQMIGFLASLHFSRIWNGPVIIVCPATVMKQWCKMLHEWYPQFRVYILHSSSMQESGKKATRRLLSKVQHTGHIMITTYEGLRLNIELILDVNWYYVVLDEGHKIRNPEADITLACKKFATPRRIILSGTPIQNSLTELWSLFDFVYPGRLGTLPVFQSQFAQPLRQGGYANASPLQVHTAYKCAVILRDLISPYLLRRMKADVLKSMPSKSEKVLFVKLTLQQRKVYEEFLESTEMEQIFEGRRHVLYGIDILCKICNHPDLLVKDEREKYLLSGDPELSGKMVVVKSLLEMWKSNKNKVLLFCQTRQMLHIVEILIKKEGYSYLRMDGTTEIKNRMALVDKFNKDASIFVFLLTTRVGGLGLNLTGADRVLIYDPNWNPSTDEQARERAWRLGQTKEVTIFRLMTAGTIEEKIYHRQIFKTFMTNKILKDPKQRRFFKSNDLYDLFSLAPAEKDNETQKLFAGQNIKEEVVQSQSDQQEDKQSDEEILKSLFDLNGLDTVVKHDIVMDQSRPEVAILEKEASKLASKAVETLKRSVLQPTIQPVSRQSSGFVFRDRPPRQSSAILDRLRGSQPQPQMDADTLLPKIVDFMKQHGGSAESQALIDKFNVKVGSEEVVLFRQLLKSVATFKKLKPSPDQQVKGYWVLKSEFS